MFQNHNIKMQQKYSVRTVFSDFLIKYESIVCNISWH